MLNSIVELAQANPLATRAAIGAFVAVVVVALLVAIDSRRKSPRLEWGGPKLGYSRGRGRR